MSSTKIDNDFFEYIISYNILTNPEYAATIVDPYQDLYFANPDIRLLNRIVLDFFSNRNVLPSMSEVNVYLKSEEDKEAVRKVLQKFKTLDKSYNISELLENTERFLREKSVYNAVLKTAESLQKKDIDPSDTLTLFEKACTISLVDSLGFDYLNSIDKHCDDLLTKQEMISTGWKWIDEKLGGGLLKDGRALYIFTGFTNVGKSIFLGNIAKNILKQNKTVVLFSLEMSEMIYSKRISSQLTAIPFSDLSKLTHDLKAKVVGFKNEHPNARLIIKEYAPKSVSINHINAFLRKLIQRGIKPDVVVLDYLNLLKPTKSYGNMYEDVKAIGEQVRASTYLFNCPWVSASQLNRSGANKESPGLETTSESIGTAFTADAQFSIWCNDDEKALGLINLGMQKNRFGPNFGKTIMKIDYNTLIIDEMKDQTLLTNETNTKNVNEVTAFTDKLKNMA